MVFLSLVLSGAGHADGEHRPAVLYAVTIAGGAIGEWNYFILGSIAEAALLAGVVYYAWTWPKATDAVTAPVRPVPSRHTRAFCADGARLARRTGLRTPEVTMATHIANVQPRVHHVRRAGGFAALYVAAAYLAAIPYFVFLVDYPSATDPQDKVALFVDHHTSMYVMHLVSFEFVALALIVVTLGVYEHVHEHAPATSQVAWSWGWSVLGCSWPASWCSTTAWPWWWTNTRVIRSRRSPRGK